jgi:hypothetical protein
VDRLVSGSIRRLSCPAAEAVTFISSVLNAVAAVASAKTGWKDARTAEQ